MTVVNYKDRCRICYLPLRGPLKRRHSKFVHIYKSFHRNGHIMSFCHLMSKLMGVSLPKDPRADVDSHLLCLSCSERLLQLDDRIQECHEQGTRLRTKYVKTARIANKTTQSSPENSHTSTADVEHRNESGEIIVTGSGDDGGVHEGKEVYCSAEEDFSTKNDNCLLGSSTSSAMLFDKECISCEILTNAISSKCNIDFCACNKLNGFGESRRRSSSLTLRRIRRHSSSSSSRSSTVHSRNDQRLFSLFADDSENNEKCCYKRNNDNHDGEYQYDIREGVRKKELGSQDDNIIRINDCSLHKEETCLMSRNIQHERRRHRCCRLINKSTDNVCPSLGKKHKRRCVLGLQSEEHKYGKEQKFQTNILSPTLENKSNDSSGGMCDVRYHPFASLLNNSWANKPDEASSRIELIYSRKDSERLSDVINDQSYVDNHGRLLAANNDSISVPQQSKEASNKNNYNSNILSNCFNEHHKLSRIEKHGDKRCRRHRQRDTRKFSLDASISSNTNSSQAIIHGSSDNTKLINNCDVSTVNIYDDEDTTSNDAVANTDSSSLLFKMLSDSQRGLGDCKLLDATTAVRTDNSIKNSVCARKRKTRNPEKKSASPPVPTSSWFSTLFDGKVCYKGGSSSNYECIENEQTSIVSAPINDEVPSSSTVAATTCNNQSLIGAFDTCSPICKESMSPAPSNLSFSHCHLTPNRRSNSTLMATTINVIRDNQMNDDCGGNLDDDEGDDISNKNEDEAMTGSGDGRFSGEEQKITFGIGSTNNHHLCRLSSTASMNFSNSFIKNEAASYCNKSITQDNNKSNGQLMNMHISEENAQQHSGSTDDSDGLLFLKQNTSSTTSNYNNICTADDTGSSSNYHSSINEEELSSRNSSLKSNRNIDGGYSLNDGVGHDQVNYNDARDNGGVSISSKCEPADDICMKSSNEQDDLRSNGLLTSTLQQITTNNNASNNFLANANSNSCGNNNNRMSATSIVREKNSLNDNSVYHRLSGLSPPSAAIASPSTSLLIDSSGNCDGCDSGINASIPVFDCNAYQHYHRSSNFGKYDKSTDEFSQCIIDKVVNAYSLSPSSSTQTIMPSSVIADNVGDGNDSCFVGNHGINNGVNTNTIKPPKLDPRKCEECGKLLFTYKQYILHRQAHSKVMDTCWVCNQRVDDVRKHLTTVHSTDYSPNQYHCQQCQSSFENYADLHAHAAEHYKSKPYECPICLKRFSQQGNLSCHLRIHSGVKPFVCNICSKTFRHSNSLRRHLRTVHSSNKISSPIIIGSNSSGNGIAGSANFNSNSGNAKTALLDSSSLSGFSITSLPSTSTLKLNTSSCSINNNIMAIKQNHKGHLCDSLSSPTVVDDAASTLSSSSQPQSLIRTADTTMRFSECISASSTADDSDPYHYSDPRHLMPMMIKLEDNNLRETSAAGTGGTISDNINIIGYQADNIMKKEKMANLLPDYKPYHYSHLQHQQHYRHNGAVNNQNPNTNQHSLSEMLSNNGNNINISEGGDMNNNFCGVDLSFKNISTECNSNISSKAYNNNNTRIHQHSSSTSPLISTTCAASSTFNDVFAINKIQVVSSPLAESSVLTTSTSASATIPTDYSITTNINNTNENSNRSNTQNANSTYGNGGLAGGRQQINHNTKNNNGHLSTITYEQQDSLGPIKLSEFAAATMSVNSSSDSTTTISGNTGLPQKSNSNGSFVVPYKKIKASDYNWNNTTDQNSNTGYDNVECEKKVDKSSFYDVRKDAGKSVYTNLVNEEAQQSKGYISLNIVDKATNPMNNNNSLVLIHNQLSTDSTLSSSKSDSDSRREEHASCAGRTGDDCNRVGGSNDSGDNNTVVISSISNKSREIEDDTACDTIPKITPFLTPSYNGSDNMCDGYNGFTENFSSTEVMPEMLEPTVTAAKTNNNDDGLIIDQDTIPTIGTNNSGVVDQTKTNFLTTSISTVINSSCNPYAYLPPILASSSQLLMSQLHSHQQISSPSPASATTAASTIYLPHMHNSKISDPILGLRDYIRQLTAFNSMSAASSNQHCQPNILFSNDAGKLNTTINQDQLSSRPMFLPTSSNLFFDKDAFIHNGNKHQLHLDKQNTVFPIVSSAQILFDQLDNSNSSTNTTSNYTTTTFNNSGSSNDDATHSNCSDVVNTNEELEQQFASSLSTMGTVSSLPLSFSMDDCMFTTTRIISSSKDTEQHEEQQLSPISNEEANSGDSDSSKMFTFSDTASTGCSAVGTAVDNGPDPTSLLSPSSTAAASLLCKNVSVYDYNSDNRHLIFSTNQRSSTTDAVAANNSTIVVSATASRDRHISTFPGTIEECGSRLISGHASPTT
ncbi:hypothetical protein GJ496_010882 [Pomphorhynchus laevis]|nr:hypothetical protein GJ496_010882 [Pomphorhynchus laevis]